MVPESEQAAVVEKVETTGVFTVAAIEDEIEPSSTKQKAKKEKPEAFPAPFKEFDVLLTNSRVIP